MDQMVGGGTTLVECKLLGRNAIGVDINKSAIMLTFDRLNFRLPPLQISLLEGGPFRQGNTDKHLQRADRSVNTLPTSTCGRRKGELPSASDQDKSEKKAVSSPQATKENVKSKRSNSGSKVQIKTYVGDARNLDKISNDSVDLIATHPPYANIIEYGEKKVEGDLSNVKSIKEFCKEMRVVADECYRVLKPGKFCAILIGDTRRHKHFVPITPRVMDEFLEAGFVLRESIIKRQWNCMTTGFWTKKSIENNFLLIMHEHVYVFRKPQEGEKIAKFSESMSWEL